MAAEYGVPATEGPPPEEPEDAAIYGIPATPGRRSGWLRIRLNRADEITPKP
jgi:hypothetical protein